MKRQTQKQPGTQTLALAGLAHETARDALNYYLDRLINAIVMQASLDALQRTNSLVRSRAIAWLLSDDSVPYLDAAQVGGVKVAKLILDCRKKHVGQPEMI